MSQAKRLFASPEYPTVPVQGSADLYPVHRIFCVGRNYAEHAKEMGVEVDREAPFYFLKDAQAIVQSGAEIAYPPGTANYHYEMELVIAMGAPAYKISAVEAAGVIFGWAAGLDMTRRDLQLTARAKQRPWDLGKNFEQSAVIAAITRTEDFGPIGQQRIALLQNGETRQEAKLADLIWSPLEIISHLSGFYQLQPGDLIYTGTPAGVGAALPGDEILGEIEGLASVRLKVGAEA